MSQKIYQIDTFTDHVFGGNPAAVCPLEHWLADDILQQIALENNLAETAYYVKRGEVYEIRWFTPTVEVDLCGHATLATAYVLFHHENHLGDSIRFYSPRSGMLNVNKQGALLTLDFPADAIVAVPVTALMETCFSTKPIAAYRGKTDYMLIFEHEEQVMDIKADLFKIAELDARGVIITAPGKEVDFVSRFFAPQSGIDEDPVTGSAHTSLIPYWSSVLKKSDFRALQLSPRKGSLICSNKGDRVEISGNCKLYMLGEIFI